MVMFRGDPGDALHRAVKMALDTGEAATHAEAHALFRTYRLAIAVGPDVARSATLQAVVLTAVNTGRRCFLGGIEVAGQLDAPLLVPWGACRTLREAVEDLGGALAAAPSEEVPLVVVGDATVPAGAREFAVRATFQGWTGGVTPLASGVRLAESQECTPAGVLAGALAVSEAFQHVRGGNATAGRREVGLSLWCPEPDVSWLAEEAAGPPLRLLPTKLWLIGLGHLGQAFLWTLGFLPYAAPSELALVLQDFDTLVEANDSTSPLTRRSLLGQKKTRAMASWAEARGFRTMITERRFAPDFTVSPDEPSIALCGVDNPQARAALEEVGFTRVVEAGLGKGPTEYLAFQVHTFPGPQRARDVWSEARVASAAAPALGLTRMPAYAALAAEGLDECGLTMLAGRSVGASFVGMAVSAIVIAEVLRELEGGTIYGLVDGSLRALGRRTVLPTEQDLIPHPGFCLAAG
jgi:hypothetical protein